MTELIKPKEKDYPLICVSDCIVDTILIDNNTVTLCFDSYGYYVNEAGDEHSRFVPYAQLSLYDCEYMDIFVVVLKRIRIFHWYTHIQKKVEFNTFVKKINSKKWKIEIIEEYQSVLGGLFYGLIRGKGIGENRFYMTFQCKKIVYRYSESS